MERLKIVDGKELTINALVREQFDGKPASRAAHIGSLNAHTVGVAAAGVRTLLHEHIDAGDNGYPTTKVLVSGAEVTVSKDTGLDTLYASYIKGKFRVDITPAGIAIVKHKIDQALGKHSAIAAVRSIPYAPVSIGDALGQYSFLATPDSAFSAKTHELYLRTKTPAQLHYLACKETPELGNNILGAAEALLETPDTTYDILLAWQENHAQVFSEYVTNKGIRLKYKQHTDNEVVYEGDNEYVVIPRSTIASSTMEFLQWQREALINRDETGKCVDYLQKPQEGPVISAMGYLTLITCQDAIHAQTMDKGKDSYTVRHVGGNEMHRYMLHGAESDNLRYEANILYNHAYEAMAGRLPNQVKVEMIPGKDLGPFVYTALTGDLYTQVAESYDTFQNYNLSIAQAKRNSRSELLVRIGLDEDEVQNMAPVRMTATASILGNIDEELMKELIEKIDNGKATPQEIIGRTSSALANARTNGLLELRFELEQQTAEVLNTHPLAPLIINGTAGITLSQYDALENGSANIPTQYKDIPISQLLGVNSWIHKLAKR